MTDYKPQVHLEEMTKPVLNQAAIDAASASLLGQSIGKGWIYAHSQGPWRVVLIRGQLVIIPWKRD